MQMQQSGQKEEAACRRRPSERACGPTPARRRQAARHPEPPRRGRQKAHPPIRGAGAVNTRIRRLRIWKQRGLLCAYGVPAVEGKALSRVATMCDVLHDVGQGRPRAGPASPLSRIPAFSPRQQTLTAVRSACERVQPVRGHDHGDPGSETDYLPTADPPEGSGARCLQPQTPLK